MRTVSVNHHLRTLIALFLLRRLFPQGMSGAGAAVVLPLQASDSPAIDSLNLAGLLRTPQLVLDPARPNLCALDLLRSFGSRLVQFPKQPPVKPAPEKFQ